MQRNRLLKTLVVTCVVFFMCFSSVIDKFPVSAADRNFGKSYFPYTYNFQGKPVAIPEPFEAVRTLNGYDFGDIPLKDVSDLTYSKNERFYVSDTGNNRILVLNTEFKCIEIIDSAESTDGKTHFNKPTSTAVMNGKLYVADTENGRIVVFDEKDYKTIAILEQPDIPSLGDYVYLPTKIGVDYAGRIYVIVRNINKGLLQLDQAGNFESFLGAPKVSVKAIDILFRKIFPRAMRDRLIKNVPTEYSSVNIDTDGFLFVVSQSSNVPPIARLNGQGSNVIMKTYQTPAGDGDYIDSNGKRIESVFVDIIPREDGGYFALDASKGRIFSYDRQGILLYVFGYPGSSQGGFYSASSLEYANDQILVADQSNGTITIFQMSEFGEAVGDAALLSAQGKSEEEQKAWSKVLRLCSNYDTAQIHLAKAETDVGNHKSAIDRLSAVGEKKYYDEAWQYYRAELATQNFYIIVGILFAVIILLILRKKYWKKSKLYLRINENVKYRQIRYSLHVIFHPFDGFWDLKRENRGGLFGAFTILGVFTFWYAIRARFSGYLFMNVPYDQVNLPQKLATILIPIILWVISNWCFTTLMDGKGTFKETFIAVCYALTPYVIIAPLQFGLSHILAGEEMAFYIYIDTVTLIWVLALIFFGMMKTHDYSISKTLITTVLTIIGISLILFIFLLFFNLFSEIYNFFHNLYREISFRFY